MNETVGRSLSKSDYARVGDSLIYLRGIKQIKALDDCIKIIYFDTNDKQYLVGPGIIKCDDPMKELEKLENILIGGH